MSVHCCIHLWLSSASSVINFSFCTQKSRPAWWKLQPVTHFSSPQVWCRVFPRCHILENRCCCNIGANVHILPSKTTTTVTEVYWNCRRSPFLRTLSVRTYFPCTTIISLVSRPWGRCWQVKLLRSPHLYLAKTTAAALYHTTRPLHRTSSSKSARSLTYSSYCCCSSMQYAPHLCLSQTVIKEAAGYHRHLSPGTSYTKQVIRKYLRTQLVYDARKYTSAPVVRGERWTHANFVDPIRRAQVHFCTSSTRRAKRTRQLCRSH